MKVLEKLESRDDSVKFLLQLADGNTIESLYMCDKSQSLTYNSTLCVSSQVGCKVGCRFCATGSQGFVRDLITSEIIEQVGIASHKQAGRPLIKAVVFAGMGEPLLNYENVTEAILQLHSNHGIENFELATVGVVPAIYKLIEDFAKKNITIRLNLSLHASTDEMRNHLIPFNSKYNISGILEAAVDYARAFDSRVRVRYMLIKGLNDTELDILRLSRLLGSKPLKLVVSAYNDNSIPGLVPPEENEILRFYEKIKERVESDMFFNFGTDISGGCGQLRQQWKDFTKQNL